MDKTYTINNNDIEQLDVSVLYETERVNVFSNLLPISKMHWIRANER